MKEVRIYLERKPVQRSNWQVRRVNDVEIPEWQNGPDYPTLEIYCEEQAQKEGWTSAGVNCGKDDAFVIYWL